MPASSSSTIKGQSEDDPIGADFQSEFDWWDAYLRTKPAWLGDEDGHRDAFPHFALSHLAASSGGVQSLELGCGPFSILAWGVKAGLLELTAIDRLASQYAALLARHSIRWPVVPTVGLGEKLPDEVRARQFDFVYSSNAIDHCQVPSQVLEQLVSRVRPGGLLVLEGLWNEGSNAEWTGLHQHDLFAAKGHLVHRDREGFTTNLAGDKPLACLEDRTVPFFQRGIRISGYEYERPGGGFEPWYDQPWYSLVFRKL